MIPEKYKQMQLEKYKKELEEKKQELKDIKARNFKAKLSNNGKILKHKVKYNLSEIGCIGIVFTFCSTGCTPFYLDSHEVELNVMKELDSEGNVSYIESYDEFENTQPILKYHSKWHVTEEGTYARTTKTYSIADFIKNNSNITNKEIIDLVSNKDVKLEDLFGAPVSENTQTTVELDHKELEEEPYIQVVVYDENTNETIVVRETVGENVLSTLAALIIIVEILCITGMLKSTVKDIYKWQLEQIRNEYQPEDPTKIEERIKSLNYIIEKY